MKLKILVRTTVIFAVVALPFSSKAQTIDLNDGRYQGNTTCTCCGKYANQPGRIYTIAVQNKTANQVSFVNMCFQNREINGLMSNGVIVIDERDKKTEEMRFWGKVELVSNTEFKLDVQWSDPSHPDPNRVLNHCIGSCKKV
ncbi:MAG: hypothetical protein K9J06_11750 [Flavobacteriales bacterium]|nr:hypothetical protein [Flavobacteriales bacterium]